MTRFSSAWILAAGFAVAASSLADNGSENKLSSFRELVAAELDTAYVLLDARSGDVLDSRWPDLNRAVSLGSLVKPYTALAYAQTHGYRYPEFECRGEDAGCWWPAGHGSIAIETAIANSCNVYFRLLAERVDHTALSAVAWRFGIAAPFPNTPRAAYVGLGNEWRSAPVSMARAYLELTRREAEPGVGPLLAGLRHSAEAGTARGIGVGLSDAGTWAKTGTAPCVHRPASNGDGYAVAIYPAPKPRYVLLVQRHGVPGRLAAMTAGEMLARLRGPMH